MRLALVVEYDGTGYSGFQYQPNARTIQEELQNAIERFTGERVNVAGAGRTDAGVHARGQVVAFDTSSDHPMPTWISGLNYHLPEEIAARKVSRVAPDFDPRRMASARWYSYTIVNDRARSPLSRRTALHVPGPLDVGKMDEAAKLFVGARDFSRFAGPLADKNASTVREVFEAGVSRSGDVVVFEVGGNAFLPHQVRRMAGALVDVGKGKKEVGEIESLLGDAPTEAVANSLPSQGLCLERVEYPDFPTGRKP